MTDRNVRLLRWLGIATLATPMIAFALMRLVPGADPMLMAFSFHFYVVGFTALAAAAACAVIIAAGRTLRETRLLCRQDFQHVMGVDGGREADIQRLARANLVGP